MSENRESFAELRERLDEIVVEVRDKDLSLEKSLDLYEEAIKIGNACAELVDKPDYTDEEAQAARREAAESGESAEDVEGEGDAEEEGEGDAEEEGEGDAEAEDGEAEGDEGDAGDEDGEGEDGD